MRGLAYRPLGLKTSFLKAFFHVHLHEMEKKMCMRGPLRERTPRFKRRCGRLFPPAQYVVRTFLALFIVGSEFQTCCLQTYVAIPGNGNALAVDSVLSVRLSWTDVDDFVRVVPLVARAVGMISPLLPRVNCHTYVLRQIALLLIENVNDHPRVARPGRSHLRTRAGSVGFV